MPLLFLKGPSSFRLGPFFEDGSSSSIGTLFTSSSRKLFCSLEKSEGRLFVTSAMSFCLLFLRLRSVEGSPLPPFHARLAEGVLVFLFFFTGSRFLIAPFLQHPDPAPRAKGLCRRTPRSLFRGRLRFPFSFSPLVCRGQTPFSFAALHSSYVRSCRRFFLFLPPSGGRRCLLLG